MTPEVKIGTSLLTSQQLLEISDQVDTLSANLEHSNTNLPQKTSDHLYLIKKHIAGAVRQVKQQEDELKDLRALADIGRIVNSSLDLKNVLRIVMDTIVRLTDAERGFLMLRDENDKFTIRVARNWEQESIQESDFAISRTIINRVTEEGQPIVTTNAQEDPRFGGQESIIAYNLRSILCVPLKVKDDLTGVIYADNRIHTGLFTESDRDLLNAFAHQAAVAIENARLFASVRQTLDEVTELKNLMDNVFASIASGVITTDIDDKITLCNRAAENILGRSSTELIEQNISLSIPELSSEFTTSLAAIRQQEEIIRGMEMNPNLPLRGSVHLQLNFSPLKDTNAVTQGVAIVLDDVTEKKRLEAQRLLFEKMVSPAVINQIDPNKVQLGGQRAQITTLFADIRGFTSYSESLSPEELVAVLNRYLAAAADAVLEQAGTIDKFMGDAVMAWFNAPIPQPDHTLRAVTAALGIRDAIHELHIELPSDAHLSFGVGMHYGDAVLGLIGTEKRVDYTAIGDSVNTAKRIQENSAANQILISNEAYNNIKHEIAVHSSEPIYAKGKSRPVEVFEVIGFK
jgi:PAS domain S-box-containing protein